MTTIAKTFNKYLKAIYNTDDPIYRSLISNTDGVPAGSITQPQDYNSGAVTNMLEHVRQLSLSLVNQLFLNLAEGKFLTLMTHEIIGIVKFSGESESTLRTRIKDYIIAPKVSRASIIYYTRPYSSPGEPELLDGIDDAAFSDVSYSDVYTRFQNVGMGSFANWWVFPAITASVGSMAYFFILKLENTAASDIIKVLDLVNRWKGDGIGYELQIVTV